MAHAYTPGLKVTRYTTIRRSRILPLKGEVVVKKGDQVKATDVVAGTELPGKVFPVNLSNKFGLPPGDVPEIMLVDIGEEVERNQAIAQTPGIFGWFKSTFEAPISGTLESVSDVTGQVMLREPATPLEISAYITGEVVEVIPEEGVVVETEGALLQGIFGIGGEKEGDLIMAVDSPDRPLRAEDLTEEMKGQVVVGGSQVDLEAYERASELGIVGLVVGGYDDNLLKEILGYDIGVAITGGEKLTTSLIMTEGFGELPMAAKTFELLASLEGKHASIHGATQIRAGVLRPEIIVPLAEKPDAKVDQVVEEGAMEVGSLVRVIREPYFGQIGKVSKLPSEPVKIDTEAKVRILKVDLEDKGEVTLPRANVELIEE